ncbi:putative endonuclease/exonuclease/phosphatase family protein [Paratrimastix pyriformis]|uniref:Endonuclease/exonuclease/phosphatase family protein n=1 Tax=Paratrimastix pyriformis TaxID=342808 RepID=A0ABQ8U544_9EUKA|nr:putative endonuclease/exonuclease/phosphatase family protein [Paratrimastix pyriformis]
MATPVEILPRTFARLEEGEEFSVLQWNNLADGLLDSFVKIPQDALQWSHRVKITQAEYLRWNADIVFAEEVNHPDLVRSTLEPLGFACFHMPKPNSVATTFGYPPDGVMLCYRKSKFTSLFHEPRRENLCNTNQVALLDVLVPVSHPDRRVIVAVTHLKAGHNPEFEELRLRQAAFLLQKIDHLAGEIAGDDAAAASKISAILGGDMNAVPTVESIQTLLRANSLSRLSAHGLVNTYAQAEQAGAYHPEAGTHWTTWKYRESSGMVKRCIDYLMYTPATSGGGLRLCAVSPPPLAADVGPDGLPSMKAASDHIPICATFKFC